MTGHRAQIIKKWHLTYYNRIIVSAVGNHVSPSDGSSVAGIGNEWCFRLEHPVLVDGIAVSTFKNDVFADGTEVSATTKSFPRKSVA
jgi:hypothetical protein